jgi:hypothetical protein
MKYIGNRPEARWMHLNDNPGCDDYSPRFQKSSPRYSIRTIPEPHEGFAYRRPADSAVRSTFGQADRKIRPFCSPLPQFKTPGRCDFDKG